MKILRHQNWPGGWFLGNFDPSAYKTDAFEVCYKRHMKGEWWPKHYHRVATEVNLLMRGEMIIQGETLSEGDVFVIPPLEVADPEFIEDCELIVVKIPSVPNDKYDAL